MASLRLRNWRQNSHSQVWIDYITKFYLCKKKKKKKEKKTWIVNICRKLAKFVYDNQIA